MQLGFNKLQWYNTPYALTSSRGQNHCLVRACATGTFLTTAFTRNPIEKFDPQSGGGGGAFDAQAAVWCHMHKVYWNKNQCWNHRSCQVISINKTTVMEYECFYCICTCMCVCASVCVYLSAVTSQVTDSDSTWLDISPKWLDSSDLWNDSDSTACGLKPWQMTRVITSDSSNDTHTHTHTRFSTWIMWSCEPWLCPHLILGEKI